SQAASREPPSLLPTQRSCAGAGHAGPRRKPCGSALRAATTLCGRSEHASHGDSRPAPELARVLVLTDRAQPRRHFCDVELDEAPTKVERRVPCHLTKRRQRDPSAAPAR